MRKHILLTGKPKTGKTTLLKRIIENLNFSCGGFYTEEMLDGERRVGFKIKSLDGGEGVLAKKNLKSKFKLGRYGVNLKDLQDIGVKAIIKALNDKEIVIIDEIGKMELFSKEFRNAVLKTLDSDKRLIGVIHRADLEFLNAIRARKEVDIFEVELNNHQQIVKKIADKLSKRG